MSVVAVRDNPGDISLTFGTRLTAPVRTHLRLLAGGGHDLSVLALNRLNQRLTELRLWPENWDDFGSPSPVPAAIDHAVAILNGLYTAATADTGLDWVSPHNISANEAGDVVFEWWKGDHKLTLYVAPETARFVRVWGANMEREMEDGPLDPRGFGAVWRWLND